MHLMLQAGQPEDYVVATGTTHSVRELCTVAFSRVGLDFRDFVRTDSQQYRTGEARQVVGDPSKAKRILGWAPTLSFEQLVHMMVDAELERLSHTISD
jgi:GDPmannose 4,6-dehydratase